LGRKEALEYLLRIKELAPQQINILAESEVIKYSVDLVHSLKRYVSVRHYRAAEKASEKESPWFTVLGMLSVIP